jgi:choline dehydrogenase-like flavoprotein
VGNFLSSRGGFLLSKKVKKLDADVVIAGGGPGGCEIARHFARKGKKVVLLEKGGYDTRFRGHTLGLLLHQERALNRHVTRGTQEGDILGLGIGVGGGTLAMVGSAFLPDADYWKKYGIDIMEHLDEAVEECKVQKVPKGFIGPGTKRIMEAAQELGYPWEPVYKYLDLAKHKRGCMDCYKMCPRGAKWTAKVSADEAVSNGATILTHVTVRDVIVEDGTAGGVKAIGRRGQGGGMQCRCGGYRSHSEEGRTA